MDQLNITDTDVVKEIINIGLAKAGDALAMVINEKVLIKCVELINLEDAFLEVDDDHINLSTKISGDIQGICYFIINKQDAAFLVNKVIPNYHSGDQFEIDEMNIGFLLELDNIISGAVTSQLANLLQMNIYGDVPKLNSWDSVENINELHERYNPLFFKTEFRLQNVTFNPGFYWFLEPEIMTKLRKMVGSEKTLTNLTA